MKNQNIPTLVITGALCLGVGFFAGTKYQSQKPAAFVNQFSRQGQQSQRGQQLPGGTRQTAIGANIANRGGSRPVAGEIMSSDTKSLTVKQPDGSNKIVLLSASTQINKAQAATITDLKVGEKVSVFGTANPDGSVTAQNVQLNPMMPGTPATPSATPKK